jgi:hypothetical protein
MARTDGLHLLFFLYYCHLTLYRFPFLTFPPFFLLVDDQTNPNLPTEEALAMAVNE